MNFASTRRHARHVIFGAALGLSLTAGFAGAQPSNTIQPERAAGPTLETAGRSLLLGTDTPVFRLTLLHNNDGESELLPSGDTGGIARFVATVERERSAVVAPDHGVLTLSSGDNFLAGPEFNAGVSNGIPFYDTIALEKVGYDAIALGNHDFDFGPDTLVDFLSGYTTPQKYLSSNLDFTAEPGLQAFVTAGVIGKSTVVTVAGQQIGIIGATTTNLPFISSPRNVVVNAVAAAVQAEVTNLLAAGVDKIVLISHLQSVLEDLSLQAQLQDIDIVVAGGGDELLANPGTELLPGDIAQGSYPLFATDFTGKQIPVVTTTGNYRYVGRLVVDFDATGEIVAIDVANSGPVRVVGTTFPDGVTPDPLCETLIEQPVTAALAAQASNVLAVSQVALDGLRNSVRTMETNQGNLVADAMRYVANSQAAAFGLPLADVALQNGGGMRDDAILPAGDITELNTFDILPFSNFACVVPNVPREQFKEILENAVSRVEFGDGRFAQVSGMRMIWDEDGEAQQLDGDGNVTVPGSRVYEVTLSDGTPIVSSGMVIPGADLTVATIDFLARGGDRYPYRGAPFTTVGFTYQQALQEYLVAGLGGVVTALDYPEGGEGRIQTLRSVAVLDPREEQPGTAPVLRNVVLEQNAPNPFNPTTRIDFALPTDAHVSLVVYDVKGRRVATLVEGSIEAGDHSVMWQGTDDAGKPTSSGLYFYVLDNGSRRITKSMSLVK